MACGDIYVTHDDICVMCVTIFVMECQGVPISFQCNMAASFNVPWLWLLVVTDYRKVSFFFSPWTEKQEEQLVLVEAWDWSS